MPFPVTLVPRSNSTVVPAPTLPRVESADPAGAGALFQTIVDSLQELVVVKTLPPEGLDLVTYRRSLAEMTGPVRPLTVNLM